MDNIVLILGEQSVDIKRTLESHHSESVTVINAFRTPREFSEYYKKSPLRVQRIIISEGSFKHDMYGELQVLRETLSQFFIQFDDCYFLVSNNKETNEVLNFLCNDETFEEAHKLRVFNQEVYTPTLVIDFCLNKIPRKHFIKHETQFENIIRAKIGGDSTYKLEEEEDEETESSSIVVLESDRVRTRELSEKLKNLNSLSNTVKGEIWVNNRLIKDIYQIEKLLTEGEQAKKFEIDYSGFYLSGQIKDVFRNVYIVTGGSKSGKTTLAYALGKSASTYFKKVLLVDCDLDNLGLSALTEQQSDYATVMVLQDFKSDFKNALRTLVTTSTKFNIVASNTSTLKELGSIEPVSFLSMLCYTCMKYFDAVIIDIPLKSLDKVIPLVQKSDKLIFTVPTHMSSLYSTVKTINSMNILNDYPNTDKLIIPVNMFNVIRGSEPLTGRSMRRLIYELYGDKIKSMTDIEISSFDLDESLMRAVKSI